MEDLVEAMGTGLKTIIARGAPDCTLYPYFLEPPQGEVPGRPLTRSRVNRSRMAPFGRGRVAAKVGEVVRMGGDQVVCADE